MADREADIHELFAEQANARRGADLLVRAERTRNRIVSGDDESCDCLWTILAGEPVLGTREVLVTPREDRPGRQPRLEVSSTPVTLQPPRRKRGLVPVRVRAVYAHEPDPPSSAEALE